jgi:enterobactin synthetase component D
VSAPIESARRTDGDVIALAEELATYATELVQMGAGRKAEFLVGRRCARDAIAACAPELAAMAVAVPIGPGRAPGWPVGLVGAITHTPSLASAAVARTRDARGLGLDIEERMSDATANEVYASIATAGELALAESALALDRASALTLLFSAKETAFKCLYPVVGRYFDYREAALVRIDASAHRCTVQIGVDLGMDFLAGTRLDVQFAVDALHIHTGAWLPPV